MGSRRKVDLSSMVVGIQRTYRCAQIARDYRRFGQNKLIDPGRQIVSHALPMGTGGESELWKAAAQRFLRLTQINGAVETRTLAWSSGLRMMQRLGRARPIILADRLYYDPRMSPVALRTFIARAIAERALELAGAELNDVAVRWVGKVISAGDMNAAPITGEWLISGDQLEPVLTADERVGSA